MGKQKITFSKSKRLRRLVFQSAMIRVPGLWEKKQRLELSRSESLLGTVRDGHPKPSGIEPAQPAFMNAETWSLLRALGSCNPRDTEILLPQHKHNKHNKHNMSTQENNKQILSLHSFTYQDSSIQPYQIRSENQSQSLKSRINNAPTS